MPRVLPAVLIAAAAAFPAHAQDWGQVATISSTMGVNTGRLCTGEGTRSDIGCPTYAPSITTAGHVSVTGNLSANAFIGDGSGLTGIGQGDRITSGTTSVNATQDRSVTISTAGTQRVVVGENGNVGIGTTAPSQILDVSGWTKTTGLIWATGSSLGSAGQISAQSTGTFSNNRVTIGAGLTTGTDGAVYSLSGKSLELATDATAGRGLLIKSGTGNVGIGTTSPQTTLQVSGSFTVSTSAQTTTPSLYVNTSGNVGIGTNSPGARLHVASTGTAMEVGDGTGSATYIGLAGTRVKFGFDGNGATVHGLTKAVTLSNNTGVGLALTATGSSVGLGGTIGDAASLLGARLVVLGTGNVGIGTTSPGKTLDVSGTAQIVSRTLVGGTGTPSATFQVSGSLLLAGNDNIPCTASVLGLVRRNPTTGRLQACR